MPISLRSRKDIRLKHFDYGSKNSYFVTICTHERKCYFGHISEDKMILNNFGKIVEQTWLELSQLFPNVLPDIAVVMPNHFHGIIALGSSLSGQVNRTPTQIFTVGAQFIAPESINPKTVTLGAIIRSFKAKCSYLIHKSTAEPFKWQRNYYEHIIRNEQDYQKICEYIRLNPQNWAKDSENQSNHPIRVR